MQYADDSLNVDNLVQRLRAIRATVELKSAKGLSSLQQLESRFPGLTLPSDFLNFFKNCDGVRMTYSMPHGRPDKRSIPVGIFEIVGSKHLQLVDSELFLKAKAPGQANPPSQPSGSRGFQIKAVPFERVPDLGVVALVFAPEQTTQPTIWIRDTTLQWHYICRNFSCYYRLAMIHMAVARWQSMFMPQGLDTVAKSWLAKLNPQQLHFDASNRAELVSSAETAGSLFGFSPSGNSKGLSEDPNDQQEQEHMWQCQSVENDTQRKRATRDSPSSSAAVIDFARLDELMESQSRSKHGSRRRKP